MWIIALEIQKSTQMFLNTHMSIDFPPNPVNGTIYEFDGKAWIYATPPGVWNAINNVSIQSIATGATGATGPQGAPSVVTGPTGVGPVGAGTELVYSDGTNQLNILGDGNYTLVTPTGVSIQAKTTGPTLLPLQLQPEGGSLQVGSPMTVGAMTAPMSALDIMGNQTNVVTQVTGTSVDCSVSNHFTLDVVGPITLTFDNVPASRAFTFTILVQDGGSNVTWPVNVYWSQGSYPTLTTSGIDILQFITFDGGINWHGAVVIRNSG